MNKDREHLSDLLDIASDHEMKTTEAAISAVSKKVRRQQERRKDGTYEFTECDMCGLEIGNGRLDVAPMNLFCVYCASKLERRKNLT